MSKFTQRLARLESNLLMLIGAAAAVFALVAVVALGWRIVTLVTAPSVVIEGFQLQVQPEPPLIEGAAVLASYAEGLTIDVADPPSIVRALLIVAATFSALVTVGLGGALWWLTERLGRGKPFVRSASLALAGAAICVMVGGILGPLLYSFARAEAVRHLTVPELMPWGLVIDLAPLGWGLALAVIVAAFQLGERLQRDTEGLV